MAQATRRAALTFFSRLARIFAACMRPGVTAPCLLRWADRYHRTSFCRHLNMEWGVGRHAASGGGRPGCSSLSVILFCCSVFCGISVVLICIAVLCMFVPAAGSLDWQCTREEGASCRRQLPARLTPPGGPECCSGQTSCIRLLETWEERLHINLQTGF
jgi:hypothetical protein